MGKKDFTSLFSKQIWRQKTDWERGLGQKGTDLVMETSCYLQPLKVMITVYPLVGFLDRNKVMVLFPM